MGSLIISRSASTINYCRGNTVHEESSIESLTSSWRKSKYCASSISYDYGNERDFHRELDIFAEGLSTYRASMISHRCGNELFHRELDHKTAKHLNNQHAHLVRHRS
jgi:hypothetical protein